MAILGYKTELGMETYKPSDPAYVSLEESGALEYWIKEFGCNAAQLSSAISECGPMAGEIRAYLFSQNLREDEELSKPSSAVEEISPDNSKP